MIKVKATREGLVGGTTATGWKIDTIFPFVALPSVAAKNLWVKIINPLNNKSCCAQVRDVGPFNEHDDEYVFQYATRGTTLGQGEEIRPLSESGQVSDGVKSNGAGIDLGEAVWNLLGMKDNTDVEWEFVF